MPPSCSFRNSTRLPLQYEMLVDIFSKQKHRKPKYELQTSYGQLQHLFAIHFETACKDLGLNGPTTVILAAIRTCILDSNTLNTKALDIHHYKKEGGLHILDVTSIQCLVGRVKDDGGWSIIDRSGCLARAVYLNDMDD